MVTRVRGKPTLRQAAEQRLSVSRRSGEREADDQAQLWDELELHRIELELQNEELSKAYAQVAELRDKYADLYDAAPIAYFTVSPIGEIIELNNRGAALLGDDRGSLVGRRLNDFVRGQHALPFADFLAAVCEGGESAMSFDLRDKRVGCRPVRAQARLFRSEMTGASAIRLVIMPVPTAAVFAAGPAVAG
jgi:PAS domain-containing protein